MAYEVCSLLYIMILIARLRDSVTLLPVSIRALRRRLLNC